MKVFITGGAGFIGSHLAERLLARRHEVLILDDLSTGSISNIEHLIGRPRFQLPHRHGRSTRLWSSELVDRCDVTIHLAAAVGVQADRRAACVHDREQRARHGSRAECSGAQAEADPDRVDVRSVRQERKSPVPRGRRSRAGTDSHSRWAYACSKALDEWLGLAYMRAKRACRS